MSRRYMMLVTVPLDEDLSLLPEDAQEELFLMNTEYPANQAPGSDMLDPRKLLFLIVWPEAEDKKALMELFFTVFDLDWKLCALQSADNIVPVLDDDDNVVDHKPEVLMDMDTETVYQFVPNRYAKYDEDGNPVGDPLSKTVNNITSYVGQKWQELM